MKRIALFVLTNIAVIAVLTIVLSFTGADRFLTSQGLNVGMLLVFSLIVGFTGAIISLLMSKPMAKWSTGAQVITHQSNSTEQWLLDTVRKLTAATGGGQAASQSGTRVARVARDRGVPPHHLSP